MKRVRAVRRSVAFLLLLIAAGLVILQSPVFYQPEPVVPSATEVIPEQSEMLSDALATLDMLSVKGRAPKTGYSRSQFGDGWQTKMGCDSRNRILGRDLKNTVLNSKCQIVSGVLSDPYTGKTIEFQRGEMSSQAVQIDHVVALSDAWQKGAQQLSFEGRVALANDPLELLAVDGPANQQKGDGDAASWLPPNKPFRCQYVARQIAVKQKYSLWVTLAEKDAMVRVLSGCPGQQLPVGSQTLEPLE